ncbi:MAG: hypothetical protein ACM3PD_09900 [Chloroflexota bacterium]
MNEGVWAGAINNGPGAMFTNNGTVNGAFVNAGALYAANGVVNGNLANTGAIDLTGGAAPLANSLTVNGGYAGGGALLVAGALTNGGRAGQLLATGAGSGTTAVTVTPVGALVLFDADPDREDGGGRDLYARQRRRAAFGPRLLQSAPTGAGRMVSPARSQQRRLDGVRHRSCVGDHFGEHGLLRQSGVDRLGPAGREALRAGDFAVVARRGGTQRHDVERRRDAIR